MQDLASEDSIKPSEEHNLLKMKNQLKINVIQAPKQAPLSISMREEVKEAVI